MKGTRHAWLLVALLWVVACLNYLDRQVIFSVFPLLQRDLDLSSLQLGLLSTAFLWVYGVLSPLAGYLADRFGRRRTILVSLAVWSAVTWLTAYVRNFPELLAARALMGVSEACYLPAALALIAETHSGRTRSLATGLHSSGIYAGMVLGGWGGGAAGAAFGWRVPFVALGIAGLLYMGVLAAGLRHTGGAAAGGSKPAFFSSIGELLRLPGYLPMVVVFIATSIANWMVYTWLPLYLYERFHMSLAQAGLTATIYIQAASVAGILAGGVLADRWSQRSSRGRLFTQGMGLVIAAPFLILTGMTGSYVLLAVALIAFGFGKGLYDCNTMPVLCQVARPEIRSTGYGIFNFSGCIAGGVVAPLAGWLKSSIGLGGCLQIAGAILLLSVLALWKIKLQSETQDGILQGSPAIRST